ncbi:undecaprenyl-diphosphatase [Candidatus Saganbacteria bacterium CG08_land_8_20_14_0_20_45_16]|uniref:Undecaprenyl-diphosphatase n=1 Tax=Candidatus Saganbacteria bacterium CG08_land_8_20_14_0_20_45_16 TaxID=2014293 RepID=A0A2H0Y0V7_UNCSA|nr:MAG: undecaprenyl-diphosphatase [Candidatus Saganbacteria bacterium CG08_land_8_20_14_0_20_45_16]
MKYLLLGLVQGLTEFLPVSSSGHLVIFQSLLNVTQSIAFDTIVHLATGLAVVLYFWRDILALFTTQRKMLWLLIVATIPTALMGFLLKDYFEVMFSSTTAIGFFLILTAMVIFLGEWLGKGRRGLKEMEVWDALFIGVAQGCAIAPGLSRSGTTISVSLGRNFERSFAAKFSFLLSIPAILGAGLLQSKAIIKAGTLGIGLVPLGLGFLAAFFSGLLAIKIFMRIIQRTSIRVFAYYCLVIGAVVILFLH